MRSCFPLKYPLCYVSVSRSSSQLERRAGLFLRQSVCKYGERSYSTLLAGSKCFSRRDSSLRDFCNSHFGSSQNTLLKGRRWKSKRAQGVQQYTKEQQQLLGDDPPLYDKKSPFWSRWVFALLAVDVIFVGLSVDMVIRNWTRPVPMTPTSEPSQDTEGPARRYELRPLWQRLGLATGEIIIGAAAGALILVLRERVVWRIRVRPVPISSLPPGRPGMKPAPVASNVAQTINVLTIETGSGRTNRFLVRDCALAPGRDLSELLLSVSGIRTRFMLSMNGARVLGTTADDVHESAILKELRASKKTEADVTPINSTPGGSDIANIHIADLRKALAYAWMKAGGSLHVPKIPSVRGAWTSGPVTGDP